MRWAASIGMSSQAWRVSTVSVTLGFCTTPLMTRCTTAARVLMFLRSSPGFTALPSGKIEGKRDAVIK
jgi:hypothetical protein